MYKITVNGKATFEVEANPQTLTLDQTLFGWDIIPLNERQFHILYNDCSYNAELLEANYGDKTFKIKLNGHIHHLEAKDRFDVLLEKMGIGSTQKNKVNHIKAPMPGLIWEIKVNVGDAVKAGDVVLVLVAMKMENALKSPGEGVVKAIKIKQGDTVDKNQILVEFE